MTTNKERFAEAYRVALTECVQNPKYAEDYFYGVEQVPGVVVKMLRALDEDTANINGPAFKLACKHLGIKHTQKAIRAFRDEVRGAWTCRACGRPGNLSYKCAACAAPLHEPAPILVRAASAQSARPVVYLIARARLAKHVAEGLDAQAAAARYGFVSRKPSYTTLEASAKRLQSDPAQEN